MRAWQVESTIPHLDFSIDFFLCGSAQRFWKRIHYLSERICSCRSARNYWAKALNWVHLPTIGVGICSEIAADLQWICKKLCADPLSGSTLKSVDPQNCWLYFLLAGLPNAFIPNKKTRFFLWQHVLFFAFMTLQRVSKLSIYSCMIVVQAGRSLFSVFTCSC